MARKAKTTMKAVKASSTAIKATILKASTSASSRVGKGTLTIPNTLKKELYNEQNDGAPEPEQKDDSEWINVGRLVFYIEISTKRGNRGDLVKELKSHSGRHLPMKPHDDSANPMAVRVGVPGRTHTTIWKRGGDQFLSRLLDYSYHDTCRTKCEASIPENVEVLDDPTRKTWWLVPVDVHFSLHKDIDLFNHPDSDKKTQVKQLMKYLRGGTQPNPPRYAWPIVREEIADECEKNASMMDRLMKKRTAKDWWKGDAKK